MNQITARNGQQAMAQVLQLLHTSGELSDEGVLSFNSPVTLTYENPRERFIFWPGFRRNPAQEFYTALSSLQGAEAGIPQSAEAILGGASHFLFSTPQLVVQGQVGKDGRLNLTAVVAERNPFTGCFGQLALQLTLLQELMANSIKKNVGTFTIQHMGLDADAGVVGQLLKMSYDNPVEDPYETGKVKVRKIDNDVPIGMIIAEGDNAMGYKSKWVRGALLPLLKTGTFEDIEDIAKQTKKVKASDMRAAMEDWIDAVRQSMLLNPKPPVDAPQSSAVTDAGPVPNLKVVN